MGTVAIAVRGWRALVDSRRDVTEVLPWFAIHVKSRAEHLVSMGLRGRGYDEFFPSYRSCRDWSDRRKQLDLPLFPGYVFCRLDINRRQPVITTPGVVSIIGLGRTPVPVADGEIAAVRRVIESGVMTVPWPFLQAGERVLIERGPLAGLEGNLLEIKNGLRIVISVELLQRSISAEIDRSWIRPIPKGKTLPLASSDKCLD
jgi:transcription antitermination factor NusG